MEKFLKIIINFTLNLLLLFNNFNLLSFAADNNDCFQKNSHNQFVNEYCAKELALNKIKNGEHYVKITDVGLNADSTVYAFDYNNIEKVITELPYTYTKEIIKFYKDNKILKEERQNKIFDWVSYAIKSLIGLGATVFVLSMAETMGNFIHDSLNKLGNYVVGFYNEITNSNIGLLDVGTKIPDYISKGVAISSALIPLSVLSEIPGPIPKVDNINYEILFSSNDNTFYALKQILSNIKYKFWKDKDALIITTSLNENSPSSSVGFVSSGVKYNDIDKQSFDEKFRLLEESLKEKIDEYEKEQKKTYGDY